MDYYVVRIYRRRKNDRRMLVGVVEEMDDRGRKAFTNCDELWDILNREAEECAAAAAPREENIRKKKGNPI